MSGRYRCGLLLAFCCLLVTGCVTKSVSESGTTFHYQWWLPIGVFLGGLVAVPGGFGLKGWSERLGWGLIILGPLAALVLAPSLFFERVFVDKKGFEVHSGIWGMTSTEKVVFDSVQSIRLTQEMSGSRRSRREIEVLYFDLKTGSATRFPLNNDIKIEAAKQIVETVAGLGIPLAAG
jgi:hypothetical protein